jgi:F-type H+-transporting ATPase subunit b
MIRDVFARMILATTILVGFSSYVSADSTEATVAAVDGDEKAHAVPDNTHGFAGPQQLDPLEFRTDIALFTLVVFLMLCAVLYAGAWKPIRQGLELRESSIAEQIEGAKRASQEATAKMAEAQSRLDSAAQQAQEIIAQARRDAESASQRIMAESQAEANRQKDRVLAEIESAKLVALSELGSRSTDIAFSLARGVIGRELRQDDHQTLIQDALRNLPSKN